MTRAGFDVAVIGGGLVGTAIGYGLVRRGLKVAILDEDDRAYRASRGNFALVWVQSKGLGMPRYAGWTRHSADIWASFAAELHAHTGIDVAYSRPGGFTLALSDTELERRRAMLARLHAQPGMISYPYEFVDRIRLERVFPGLGPEVVGASYCPLDGHVNSLRLFRALHTGFAALGGCYLPGHGVEAIAGQNPGFSLATAGGPVTADRVVLAAGVGNARLGPMVGINAPVRPQRGQVIVTEKAAPFLTHPIVTLRQTDEGGIMIGDLLEEVGADTHTGLGVLATMAERAVRMFPLLGRLNVVRTWAALRVMTPDGFPIYDQSVAAPGAFLCTCHSGVTLAAVHADELAAMIAGNGLPDTLAPFSGRRFDVPAAA